MMRLSEALHYSGVYFYAPWSGSFAVVQHQVGFLTLLM